MGQRLNTEIWKDGKCQLNCYFHWSGYTGSAITITTNLLPEFKEADPGWTLVDLITRFIRAIPDAGFPQDERNAATDDKIKDLLEKYPAQDRDCGLMAISEKGIEDTRFWEEARVTLDLDKKTIGFDAMWKVEEDDLKAEERCSIPTLDVDLTEIPFEDFEAIFGGFGGTEMIRDKHGIIWDSIY